MKLLFFGFLLMVCTAAGNSVWAQDTEPGFTRSDFYSAMSGDKEAAINKQIDLVAGAPAAEKDAYEGALLMKKAGIIGNTKKKLDLFKSGRKKLEAAIQKDSSNTEFRFLRLMIQEHAPGILGYKGEMDKDRLYIKNNFKKLPIVVQGAIREYSKESKILKPADL